MILEILKDPNPILRNKSESIKEIDESIHKLAEDMKETLISSNGIGLAAPQIGHNVRMLVIMDDKIENMIDSTQYPICVMINPVIIKESDEKVKMTERCLSFPNKTVRIERSSEIRVRFYDLQGIQKTVKLKHVQARCIEHEIDHLNGVLFTDYEKS